MSIAPIGNFKQKRWMTSLGSVSVLVLSRGKILREYDEGRRDVHPAASLLFVGPHYEPDAVFLRDWSAILTTLRALYPHLILAVRTTALGHYDCARVSRCVV